LKIRNITSLISLFFIGLTLGILINFNYYKYVILVILTLLLILIPKRVLLILFLLFIIMIPEGWNSLSFFHLHVGQIPWISIFFLFLLLININQKFQIRIKSGEFWVLFGWINLIIYLIFNTLFYGNNSFLDWIILSPLLFAPVIISSYKFLEVPKLINLILDGLSLYALFLVPIVIFKNSFFLSLFDQTIQTFGRVDFRNSTLLILAVPILIYKIKEESLTFKRIIQIVLFSFIVVAGQGRAVFVATAINSFLTILLLNKKNLIGILKYLIIITIAVSLLNSNISRMQTIVNLINDNSIQARILSNDYAFTLFQMHPLVGAGLGTMLRSIDVNGNFIILPIIDNLWYSLLAKTGIIGFLLVLVLLTFVSTRFISYSIVNKTEITQVLSVCLPLFLFVATVLSAHLIKSVPVFIVFILLYVVIPYKKKESDDLNG
jgi:hypothetical protein